MDIVAAFAGGTGWYRSDRYRSVRSSDGTLYISLDEGAQGFAHYSPFQGFNSDDPRAPRLPGFRSDCGKRDLLNDFFTMARKHQEATAVYSQVRSDRFEELNRATVPLSDPRWGDNFQGKGQLEEVWRKAIDECVEPTLDFVGRWGFLGLLQLSIERVAEEPDVNRAGQRWVQSGRTLVAPGFRAKVREGHYLDRPFDPGWVPYDDAMASFFPFGILPPNEVLGEPGSHKPPFLAPGYCERVSAIVDISTDILSDIEKLETVLHPEQEIMAWELELALKNLNVETKLGLFVDESGSPRMDFAYLTLFDAVKLMFIISKSSQDRDIRRCRHCRRLFAVDSRSRAVNCSKSCQTSAKQARYREKRALNARKKSSADS